MENSDNIEQKSEEKPTKNHKILRAIRALIPVLFFISLFLSYFSWSHQERWVLFTDFLFGLPISISIIALLNVVINKTETEANKEVKKHTGLRTLRALIPIITLILACAFGILGSKLLCSSEYIGRCAPFLSILSLPVWIVVCVVIVILLSKKIDADSQASTKVQQKDNKTTTGHKEKNGQ